jgi:hypothetical protein
MNGFILALYLWLVRLYPPGFRAEFGEELRQVFSQALGDCSRQHRFSALSLIAREMRDLPASMFIQHRAERRSLRALRAAGAVQVLINEEVDLMTRRKTILLLCLAAQAYAVLLPACAYGYTIFQLGLGRLEGVYPSPEAGIRSLIESTYTGLQRVEIEYAGTNSFDGSFPHVWYVIARVWADPHPDGQPLNPSVYDSPQSFFLKVHDGWIHIPEGAMPELIGLAMQVFHLEGQ